MRAIHRSHASTPVRAAPLRQVSGPRRSSARPQRSYAAYAPPSKLVTLGFDGNVAILKLNNPDKLNALTTALGDCMEYHVAYLKQRTEGPAVRALVVTGEGRAFSAGGDLEFLAARSKATADENVQIMLRFYNRFLCIRSLPFPVLAAINGPAIGAGMCFATAADIRFAAKDAKLGYNFVKIGIHPGMAATHFLPRVISPQIAADLLMSGDIITGEEAKRIGLVRDAVDTAKVFDVTMEAARKIAKCSPISVKTLTETLRKHLDTGLDASLMREAQAQAICYAAPDLAEGLASIKAKRDPVF